MYQWYLLSTVNLLISRQFIYTIGMAIDYCGMQKLMYMYLYTDSAYLRKIKPKK